VTTSVGPTRLVSRGFGYSVAYRTVEGASTGKTTIGLFVYDRGRWRNVTPPTLRADGIDVIDDVTFADPRHGWVAGYNCGEAAVFLYRTTNGGRSWQSLGKSATRSCGGGPTFLSFADGEHGWMEPVSPNGPVGVLYGTNDGGKTWKRLAVGPPVQVRPGAPALPCLAPIRFVSRATGWLARCGNGAVFSTDDGGRHWRRATIAIPTGSDARFDLPVFFGRAGVIAATLGTRSPTEAGHTRAVVFSVSRDGGQDWSIRSVRPIASCAVTPFFTASWPASVADARVWWIVAGRSRPIVQVTSDAGRRWHSVAARGLPTRSCSVTSVSASGAKVAWAVARDGGSNTGLFRTGDGGRTWQRTTLLRR
jgi:photosystem II stability/assembly factor-like uncharacterized protein